MFGSFLGEVFGFPFEVSCEAFEVECVFDGVFVGCGVCDDACAEGVYV